jgi:chemotaxis protein CheX
MAALRGRRAMNVRYINPFVTSTKNVFATMLNTHVLIGKARVREPDEARADVAAFIGFSGDACGSVRLCFSKITAVRVASKFADMDVDPASPELADALGELANMVAGHAKASLAGLDVSISLPRVLLGGTDALPAVSHSPVLVLPCDSALGRFSVEVTMDTRLRPTPLPEPGQPAASPFDTIAPPEGTV